MIDLHDCSREDRQRALQCAARVMHSRWPTREANATLEIAGRPLLVTYSRQPSGALQVLHPSTGAVIAQSVPAELTVLDPEHFPEPEDPQALEACDKVAACATALDLLQVLAVELRRPCFRGMRAADLAYVCSIWADRWGD